MAKMRERTGLGDQWDVPSAAQAMYERLYDEVVETVPADQLVIWQASDGWAPLCAALGVDVPDEPFPHMNTSAEFQERAGLAAE